MGSFFTFLIFHAPSALKRRELHVLVPSRFDDFGRTNPILIGADGAEPLNSARYLGQHAAPPTDAERSPSKLTLAATTPTRDLHPFPSAIHCDHLYASEAHSRGGGDAALGRGIQLVQFPARYLEDIPDHHSTGTHKPRGEYPDVGASAGGQGQLAQVARQ